MIVEKAAADNVVLRNSAVSGAVAISVKSPHGTRSANAMTGRAIYATAMIPMATKSTGTLCVTDCSLEDETEEESAAESDVEPAGRKREEVIVHRRELEKLVFWSKTVVGPDGIKVISQKV